MLCEMDYSQISIKDLANREKDIVTKEEFKNTAEPNDDIEVNPAATELFQAGHLEICGIVSCPGSRGMPTRICSYYCVPGLVLEFRLLFVIH